MSEERKNEPIDGAAIREAAVARGDVLREAAVAHARAVMDGLSPRPAPAPVTDTGSKGAVQAEAQPEAAPTASTVTESAPSDSAAAPSDVTPEAPRE